MKIKSLILLLSLFVVACNPFKVTDPNDPRFNLKEFQFKDYRNGDEVNKALNIIFPIGVEKQEVEKLLVGILHLKPTVAWHQSGAMRKKGAGDDYYYVSYIGPNTSKNNIYREFITAKYNLRNELIFYLEYGVVSKNKGNESLLLPWLLDN